MRSKLTLPAAVLISATLAATGFLTWREVRRQATAAERQVEWGIILSQVPADETVEVKAAIAKAKKSIVDRWK